MVSLSVPINEFQSSPILARVQVSRTQSQSPKPGSGEERLPSTGFATWRRVIASQELPGNGALGALMFLSLEH